MGLNFIYVYDSDTRDKLIRNGYSMVTQTIFKGKTAFLFANYDNIKLDFSTKDLENLEFSNVLCF